MEFRTELRLEKPHIKINYNSKIILLGSCFSDEIGGLLQGLKFNVLRNPLGIIYNPLIICKLLIKTIRQEKYTQDELVELNGLFHHFDLHSKHSNEDPKLFLKKINTALEKLNIWLKNADFLFLTLGSSIAYFLSENDTQVGNCHKFPAAFFNKKQLQTDEIYKGVLACLDELKTFNPKLEVIFTISPVRHIKEGIIENSVSKANLICAVSKLVQDINHASYFPAYELLLDDLRDYRFYGDDLIHPSSKAIQYIFDKFKTLYFNKDTITLKHKIFNINKGIGHRSFNSASESHQLFIKKLIANMVEVEKVLDRPVYRESLADISLQLVPD